MHRSLIAYTWCFLISIFLLNAILGQENTQCGECDESSCQPPRDCLAGLVKDSCNCCYECGKKEGERCGHESLPFEGLGRCGENLQCIVRNDLEDNDPPDAICECDLVRFVCGSDGKTYDNICQLTEARYSRRNGLRAVSSEPCKTPPRIVQWPENVRNISGRYAIMSCEVKAWPVARISWEFNKGHTFAKLPGNNTRIVIQARNGPNIDETTSWLLFLRLTSQEIGTYTCRAENAVGSAISSATVQVIELS
ncbi:insulin-like growth factor-binding protein-related protein 1 [Trichonephila clavata]|uniref:Insulin-like growth factor-binding protein-related protein 1 n=1 Tax=Trichonephila clavata TaxID=2740835 RepID=A0A8X6F8Y3_TRICU|nr:insulin-like growth factor-binding protein-related protein 1 [Trichonephila clavata]